MKAGRGWLVVVDVVLGGLALVVIVCAVQAVGSAARPYGNDFTSYLTASRAFWSGANPYLAKTLFPFIYPLSLCVIVWPLTHVPLGAAAAVWYAGSAGAIAGTVAMMGALQTPSREWRRWIVAAGLVCLVLTDVIQNNLVDGQINAIVLVLCALFGWLRARGSRNWAAVALGAAIALKLTPIVLVMFLVRRQAWRDIGLACAATAVFAIGVPWLVSGSAIWSDYQYYAQTFLSGRLVGAGPIVTHHRAFALVEVLRQWSGSAWAAGTWIAAAIVTAGLLIADRPRSPIAEDAAAGVSLYAAGALLISPMSEVHHVIFLLPGLSVLSWRALAGRASPAATVGVVLVLLAVLALRYVPFAAFAAVLGTCVLLGEKQPRVSFSKN